jgi:cold shock protein
MPTGKVRFYNADRGFGFITPDRGGENIFFHIKSCADGIEELSEGQCVRFEERQSTRSSGKQEAFAVVLV